MGKLADKINEMIRQFLEGSDFTSASPGHINKFILNSNTTSPDLLEDIKGELDQDTSKEAVEQKNVNETVKTWKDGNVDDIAKLTSDQMGTLTNFVQNPAQFVFGTVFRKFAKGAGVITLVVILFETVKTIVDMLFAPGRALDVRFREQIDNQIIIFLERKEQAELRQGFKQLITTTIFGLRGSRITGQVGGNFYNPERIPYDFLDQRRVQDANITAQNAMNRPTQIFTLSPYRRIR